MFRRWVIVLGVISLAFCSARTAMAAALYTVVDIGVLPGYNLISAYAINSHGQVVGYGQTSVAGPRRSFLYSNGTMTDIGTLPNSYSPWARGINDNGQVIGTTFGNDHTERGFLYSGGNMVDLGWFSSPSCRAYGINSHGQVVGDSHMVIDQQGYQRAFVYSNGLMTALETLPGCINSSASAINDNGQIVGSIFRDTYVFDHACLWSSGTVSDLGTLGGDWSAASAINNSGQIVGGSYTTSGDQHAFLYDSGKMKDLGILPDTYGSKAWGINAKGEVVGYCLSYSLNRAFIYRDGVMMDLNSLVDPNSGWNLIQATAINDNGWICGYGYNPPGKQRAFILIPVPEPSTIALFGMSAFSLLAWTWRRSRKAV